MGHSKRRTHRLNAIVLGVGLAFILGPRPALAQPSEHQHSAPATSSWQWSIDANVFAGYNYQRRKFTDFDAVESQNWLMGGLSKSTGAHSFELHGMFSFEPFTLRDIGSPQVFQTGETFHGAPLIDYQHPHDLIMNLGAVYRRTARGIDFGVAAYAVGPAPLGPTTFMHRASAADNPQSPLSHHHLDATHVTPGVITLSAGARGFRIEAGAFHGREPDEDRLDLDTAALDSYGARLSWADGPWQAQISGADLKTPERTSPYDATRLTASVSFATGDQQRAFSWSAAVGQNRGVFGTLEAYLVEGRRRIGSDTFYGRAESVDKDILDAGFHPIGTAHTHRPSRIGALTIGYVRTIRARTRGELGIGGDITGYRVPDNLGESYGSPVSFHAFLRYRVNVGVRHAPRD